ncbi:hypothetical protein TNCV_4926451 [Trichonephila clavipes]|nr:hypothetical protein TNCV_4926451 [Trichonephila clavipes]
MVFSLGSGWPLNICKAFRHDGFPSKPWNKQLGNGGKVWDDRHIFKTLAFILMKTRRRRNTLAPSLSHPTLPSSTGILISPLRGVLAISCLQ